MRSSGTPEELERRRARAIVLVMEHDYTTAEASEAVGATIRTIQRWLANYREAGEAGIAAVPASGRPPALGPKQLAKLEKILLKGPLAAGFPNELWTCRRVVRVIEKRFGVTFHTSHMGRILQDMGWTPQKPERRAIERDEDGIERFIKFEWKKIVKKPRKPRPP